MSAEINDANYGNKVVPVDFLKRSKIEGHDGDYGDYGRRLKSGDGDGTSGDMERRLSLVEDALTELRRDVGEVKVSMATLTERVSHLPGKGFIVKALGVSLAAITALIAFAQQIQQLVK